MTFGSLRDPALLSPPPSGDAVAPDNDRVWQEPDRAKDAGLDPTVRKEALLQQCEQRVDRAWSSSATRSLAAEVEAHSCTALKGGRACVKCRMCPNEGAWTEVSAYYRGQKAKIFVCAEKNLSQEEVETSVQHQLMVAYDHCRQGMRVPFVGIQAPWALTCAATACSEGREPRAVLDAVFNACMADEAPKGRRDPNGGPFPPFPPAVAEAETAVPAVPAPPMPSAPFNGGGDEQHKARVGEV